MEKFFLSVKQIKRDSNSATNKNKKGFSLIEMLIVLGLIAVLITSFGLPKTSRQKAYRNYFRQLSLMSKRIKNRAQIERSTYRMVFYMLEDDETNITVEVSEGAVLLGSEKESKEKFEKLFKNRRKKNEESEKDESEESFDAFKPAKKFSPDSLKRPEDLIVKQIEIAGLDELFEPEGVAMFHYFSNGLVEEALIQVQTEDESLKWTLLTDPLTGEIYTYGGHKTLREISEP